MLSEAMPVFGVGGIAFVFWDIFFLVELYADALLFTV
jgi:hypothetical protein